MSEIRFQLDEHMANAIARALRLRDIDVLTVVDAGLRGASDRDILVRSSAAGRVVVTEDAIICDCTTRELRTRA